MVNVHRRSRIFWAIIVLMLAIGQVLHAHDVLSHGANSAEVADCSSSDEGCTVEHLCFHSHDASLPVLAALPPLTFSFSDFVIQDETLCEGQFLEIDYPPQRS